MLTAEGRRILQKIAPADYVAAMCIEGRLLSSEELSDTLSRVAVGGKSTVDFVIGGSYGLSREVKQRADLRLSMSRMTFPHQMARMILSEQIYRALAYQKRNRANRARRTRQPNLSAQPRRAGADSARL